MMTEGRTAVLGKGPIGAPRPLVELPPAPEPAGLVHVPKDEPPVPVGSDPHRGWAERAADLVTPARIVPLVVAVLVLSLVVLLADRGESGPAPGEAIVEVHGVALVQRAAGGTDRVTDRTRLVPGDRMAMASGTADLELADDVRFEAVAERGRLAATEIEMAKVPTLVAGPLLVSSPEPSSLRAGSGRVRFGPSSVARVSRTSAVAVDVFRGRASLSSAGVAQAVPALRTASVVADGDVTGTRPLTYRASDAWDRRYLGDAISLDRQLTPLVAGMRSARVDARSLARRLAAEIDGAPTGAALERVTGSRKAAFDGAVGLAVVGASDSGTFHQRWDRAFQFHDAGAGWGLVAMDLGAEPDDVTDALASALDLTSPASGDEVAVAETGSIDPETGRPVPAGTPGSVNADGSIVPGGTTDGVGGTGVTVPGGGATITVPGGTPSIPGVTVPGVTTPGVSLPPVTLPGSSTPVTLPPVVATVVPTIPVVTTIVQTLPTVLAPVCTLTGPLTGGGGLLGGVTGPGGLLPVCP